MGYNVVRVFLNSRPGGMPGSVDGLSPEYLDNVVDLLDKARTHGIQIVLTQDWLPESAAWGFDSDPMIDNVNAMYLSRGGVETNQRFYREWLGGLAARGAAFDALLAYELRNELYFTESYPPFSLTSGMVTTANGEAYDLDETGAHRRLLEENLVSWVDTMRAEILAIDPTALVTVGLFQPKGPNTSREGDDRIIETEQVIQSSSLDFIDLHGYPGGELDLAQIVENFGLTPVSRKPIVLGEFGAEHGPHPTIDDAVRALVGWQVDSCAHGFGGWMLWTWDTAEQPEFWTGVDEDQAIGRALSPGLRPDPCEPGELGLPEELATDSVVRASSGGSPSNVVDGVLDTVWSAGAGPIQWVELDLGASRTVESIRLLVAQDPPGPTTHVVSVRGESGDWREVATLSVTTIDGQWLDVVPSAPLEGVRFIGIETVESPSWVAWREISILGN
ncbi:MAG: discoidin domain-containing protein [Acidimicrobiia bacterium]